LEKYRRVEDKMGNNIKYEVDEKTCLKVANYLRGISGVEEEGNTHSPYFVCKEGVIYFLNSRSNIIIHSEKLKFSDNEELNNKLIHGLEVMLKK
jgi:hypothetical protein